jgi:hypothetical protein
MRPKAGSSTTVESNTLHIDRLAAETIIVPIVGTAPLIVHRFSEKRKRMMLEAMQGKDNPKQPKNPEEDFRGACYRLPQNGHARFGFPVVGFKAATVAAARFYRKVTMTQLRQCLFFSGEIGLEDRVALTEIQRLDKRDRSEFPSMREDVVKNATGVADIRYRPEFWPWRAELKVTYVSNMLSRDSVLSLIDAGGMACGVGEWRPERGGVYGTYQIDTARDIKVVRA